MGKKIDNAKTVLGDAKARGILIVLFFVGLLVIGFIFLHLRSSGPGTGASAAAAVPTTPDVKSVPGVGEPPREYVKLVEKQTQQQAEAALKAGTAAIPTLIRSTYVDDGAGALPSTPTTTGCSSEALARAKTSGVTANELRCRGCSLEALKGAGYSSGELMTSGFSSKQLKSAGFSAKDLRDAGFSAKDTAGAGFSTGELAQAGYTAGDIKAAGKSAEELQRAGFTIEQLCDAGVTTKQLTTLGLSNNEIAAACPVLGESVECGVDNLTRMRSQTTSAKKFKGLGCSVKSMVAANFTVNELRAIGYSAWQLKQAGFSARQLYEGGYTVKSLRSAGFSAKELRTAGVSALELRRAGFTAGELKAAGFSAAELKAAGFSATELRDAGYGAQELKDAGFSSDQMKNAGFSSGDLVRAGFAGNILTETKQVTKKTEPVAEPVKDEAPPAPKEEIKAKPSEPKTWDEKLETYRKEQTKNMTRQDYQDQVRRIHQGMSSQASDLFASWAPIKHQKYVEGVKEQPITGGAGTSGAASTATQSSTAAAANTDMYRAGKVVFAVLDTGINSDEPSPVMATIVSGKLKGSKVLGEFKRVDKKVVLKFNMLSIPYLKNSIAINAVAIDENTARTAMATHVNNHYWLRYGTLFASSFASGLGQAIQSSGAESKTDTTGTETNFFDDLNPSEKALVALGNVGQQFGNVMQPVFNTPPTVKVAPGTGIGLLLMTDLKVPKA